MVTGETRILKIYDALLKHSPSRYAAESERKEAKRRFDARLERERKKRKHDNR